MPYADRYYGESSPFTNMTTENLRYLTLKNSIADLVRFANEVDLPFDKNNSSSATKAVSQIQPIQIII